MATEPRGVPTGKLVVTAIAGATGAGAIRLGLKLAPQVELLERQGSVLTTRLADARSETRRLRSIADALRGTGVSMALADARAAEVGSFSASFDALRALSANDQALAAVRDRLTARVGIGTLALIGAVFTAMLGVAELHASR